MNYSILFLVSIHCTLLGINCDHAALSVVDHGAVGDGQSDDTDAFAKAWEAACASSSSYVVLQIPSDKTFLIQPLRFNGPCMSKSITVQIDGQVVAPEDPSEWKQCENVENVGNDNICREWIHFYRVHGLQVVGQGTIDGRGQKWWTLPRGVKPTALKIADSNNVFFGGGLQLKDSPQMHVVFDGLTSSSASNVTINAPEDSPNTDGIHVAHCKYLVIERSRIGTGDDCISIVDGSFFLLIRNIICGPGHGISIGSLGKNGVEDRVQYIRVSDIVFIGGQNGARIKTWQGGRGYAKDILFERLLYHGTSNPIIIDQYYCDHEICEPNELAVTVSNVTFREVLGTTNQQSAVVLNCSESVPCKDILIDNMQILTSDDKVPSYECSNVFGTARGHKVPELSCLW